MKRALTIQKEVDQITTIKNMTSIFEAIASIHIGEIKDKVVSSTAFFNELWNIYKQVTVDDAEYAERRHATITEKPALVVVTSDGGLIGDIDERIVAAMAANPKHKEADIYVIGGHGSILLGRRGLKPQKVFVLPDTKNEIDVSPMAAVINKYRSATVYYQTYVSLLKQDVARIDLFSAVGALGAEQTASGGEVISPRDYIFEPSVKEIIIYMESVMLEIALGQIILESKLAQYASRFNAMSRAKGKAKEMESELMMTFNRAKRSQGDERTKEILGARKTIHKGQ